MPSEQAAVLAGDGAGEDFSAGAGREASVGSFSLIGDDFFDTPAKETTSVRIDLDTTLAATDQEHLIDENAMKPTSQDGDEGADEHRGDGSESEKSFHTRKSRDELRASVDSNSDLQTDVANNALRGGCSPQSKVQDDDRKEVDTAIAIAEQVREKEQKLLKIRQMLAKLQEPEMTNDGEMKMFSAFLSAVVFGQEPDTGYETGTLIELLAELDQIFEPMTPDNATQLEKQELVRGYRTALSKYKIPQESLLDQDDTNLDELIPSVREQLVSVFVVIFQGEALSYLMKKLNSDFQLENDKDCLVTIHKVIEEGGEKFLETMRAHVE